MNLLGNVVAGGKGKITDASASGFTLHAPADSADAGAILTFAAEAQDWSGAQSLVFNLRANGAHRLRLQFTHGRGIWTLYLIPRPGLTAQVVIPFAALTERQPNTSYPGYSQFGGGPEPVQLSEVRRLTISFNQVAPVDKTAIFSDIRLCRDTPPDPQLLDPATVVDARGQWTGERGVPRTKEEIRAAWEADPPEFTGFPGHTDATGANASSSGAIAEATGFFRVVFTGGRWWLADPDGYPFFSLGVDCVRPSSEGPVGDGREPLFAYLAHAQKRFGSKRNSPATLWADFYQRNLQRRYGTPQWAHEWSAQTIARLRSWGFNTIGNWSDPALTRQGRMPYTTNIAALSGMCERLPDVYAPGFAAVVRAFIEPEVTPFRSDHMLLGYFVGNEPRWTFGGHRHPFNTVFTSPEYLHTRNTAIQWVRDTYRDDLAAVNAAWATSFQRWEDLTRADQKGIPDVRLGSETLKRDADMFMGQTLGAFYDICCREIRAIDPDHLLLGGRFYTPMMAEPYVRACRSFDVYSFNFYNWNAPVEAIERVTALSGLPVLIGEFHYGVEGRGLNGSLVAAMSQEERGLAYRHFVENAAACPSVVGTHWFQWVDQPVTGRFDGECYNIGLVDITDVPYHDFLAPVQDTHSRLYNVCRGAVAPYSYPHPRPPAW